MLTILVPVLGRPHRIGPLIGDMVRATPEPFSFLFIASEGDTDTLTELAGLPHIVVGPPGTYPPKITAGFHACDTPWVFTGADDLHFHPGWLSAALAHDDGAVGVIGTNDLHNPRVLRGEHATHSLVRRSYVNGPGGAYAEPGHVLHAGYHHHWCDDELVGLAQKRGLYAHAEDSVVEHLHHYAGKSDDDATYELGRQNMTRDRSLHMRRKRLWRR